MEKSDELYFAIMNYKSENKMYHVQGITNGDLLLCMNKQELIGFILYLTS